VTAPTPPDLVERIPPATQRPDIRRRGPHWDRVALGVFLTAAGTGLLLDGQFVAVPWHAAPAAGVILVGIAMLLSLVPAILIAVGAATAIAGMAGVAGQRGDGS
jgi:hypothetical protein